MGRNNRKKVLKTRYRKPGKTFGTKFSLSSSTSSKARGKILGIKKVSYEELWRVGDYLPFEPEALLKEFRLAEIEKGGSS